MTNWKKMRENIPNKIKTKYKIVFDVLWQDNLVDGSGKPLHGITRFNPNQIILDNMQSDREAVLTFYHEYIHAISDSYEIEMTETQVAKIEKSFLYMKQFFEKLEGKE
jgi:Zn-dependent peptidase ImmA (M78 family)